MNYTLVVFRRAHDDAQECFDRLSRHSMLGAETWYAAYRTAAQDLIVNAEVHAVIPLRGSKDDPIRSMPFKTRHGKTYELIYRIRDNYVHVLRVRSPGQRPIRRKDLP